MTTNGSPTIKKPATSSAGPLPSIPSLSPDTSSSSDSFDSSRPDSGSSATSRSVSPSPIPKSVPTTDSHESIELPVLPSTPSIPQTTSASELQRQNDPPRSVQLAPVVSSEPRHEDSWLSRLGSFVFRRHWFTNTLGSLNLGLALIGMFVLLKLAIWTAWNDTIAACGQLANVRTPGAKIGPSLCDWL